MSATPIAFPSVDPRESSLAMTPSPSPQRRQHLLSFRRISLLGSSPFNNRQSTASIASYPDSVADASTESLAASLGAKNTSTSVHASPGGYSKSVAKGVARPASAELRASPLRRTEPLPTDEPKEVKRRKVIVELYETEIAYVDGLDLIYNHFLVPLIHSLDGPAPLLNRAELTSVFSNFVDIWNLHRSFSEALYALLADFLESPYDTPPPSLSPILISHFPFLSLYTPFVTSFPDLINKLASLLETNPAFLSFIKSQEAHDLCRKLKLQDWLLTIVQRCPRYMLLLKDLITRTDVHDPEHARLVTAKATLARVTSSLDSSLETHAQTLALLNLQRNTSNLPIQLICPGRVLIKRGSLAQEDNSSTLKTREFLLFSDCLIWLLSDKVVESDLTGSPLRRPQYLRGRSNSENELLARNRNVRSAIPKKVSSAALRGSDEKWSFKGKIDLVDLDVVSTGHEEQRLEFLSPEISFAVYAASTFERDAWANVIRGAKSSLLASLNMRHPNSTLTSSASTQHLRRSLQALPYLPESFEDANGKKQKRSKVDHFVPAIWVPDGKADGCMRCGKPFGWRRRRHHCRLCGRCVCADCSGKTFFIADPSASSPSKAARSCNACYETVFPLLDPSVESFHDNDMGYHGGVSHAHSGSTLSSFPSWKTTKLHNGALEAGPSALMSLEDDHVRTGLQAKRRMSSGTRPTSHPSIPLIFQESGEMSGSSVDVCEDDDEDQHDSEREIGSIGGQPGSVPSSVTSLPARPFRTPDLGDQVDRKRFSMPAIAVQTTPVTARTSPVSARLPNGQYRRSGSSASSPRFSLVLNGGGRRTSLLTSTQADMAGAETSGWKGQEEGTGLAVAKLTEILESMKRTEVD